MIGGGIGAACDVVETAFFYSGNNNGTANGSVAPQFVDARLGPGLRVDPLDDHCTVEAGFAVPAADAAGHDHRIRRHLAPEDLAGRPVDDLGRRAEIDAHRQYGALADTHALGHFGPRADERAVA